MTKLNESLVRRVTLLKLFQFLFFSEAIYKTSIEEVSFFLVLEFLGFFSILFDKVQLVLIYSSAYLVPSIRITLNLAFSKQLNMTLLIFQVLKIVCALGSLYFPYLVRHEPNSNAKLESFN